MALALSCGMLILGRHATDDRELIMPSSGWLLAGFLSFLLVKSIIQDLSDRLVVKRHKKAAFSVGLGLALLGV